MDIHPSWKPVKETTFWSTGLFWGFHILRSYLKTLMFSKPTIVSILSPLLSLSLTHTHIYIYISLSLSLSYATYTLVTFQFLWFWMCFVKMDIDFLETFIRSQCWECNRPRKRYPKEKKNFLPILFIFGLCISVLKPDLIPTHPPKPPQNRHA